MNDHSDPDHIDREKQYTDHDDMWDFLETLLNDARSVELFRKNQNTFIYRQWFVDHEA